MPRRDGEGSVRHAVCQDEDSLIYLANLAVLEFHTWLSTKDEPENPVRLVLDLDPPDNVDLAAVRVTSTIPTYAATEPRHSMV